MKKLHPILQIALLVYFGAFLIFFIAFDTLGGIFGMEEITSDSMVTITLIGLILFLAAMLHTAVFRPKSKRWKAKRMHLRLKFMISNILLLRQSQLLVHQTQPMTRIRAILLHARISLTNSIYPKQIYQGNPSGFLFFSISKKCPSSVFADL